MKCKHHKHKGVRKYKDIQKSKVIRKSKNYSSDEPNYYKGYSANMPDYFREFGCFFKIDKNELKMFRSVNDGEFSTWGWIIGSISFIVWYVGGCLYFVYNLKTLGIFEKILFFLMFGFGFVLLYICKYSLFTVNSSGITVRTICKKYFIPKDKIDYCSCKIVERVELPEGYNEKKIYYSVFIMMKDRSVFRKKIYIDTGLCYKDKFYVDYLVGRFNELLVL